MPYHKCQTENIFYGKNVQSFITIKKKEKSIRIWIQMKENDNKPLKKTKKQNKGGKSKNNHFNWLYNLFLFCFLNRRKNLFVLAFFWRWKNVPLLQWSHPHIEVFNSNLRLRLFISTKFVFRLEICAFVQHNGNS